MPELFLHFAGIGPGGCLPRQEEEDAMLRLLLAVAIVLSSPAPAALGQAQSKPTESAVAAMREAATAEIDRLRAAGLIAGSDRTKVEAEVNKQLDRMERGRSFSSIRRNVEAEIAASDYLSKVQKDEVLAILDDFASNRISYSQAERRMSLAGEDGWGAGEILIINLFILLVVTQRTWGEPG